jgi:branched-chain amino acid transport system ATP-binding protein
MSAILRIADLKVNYGGIEALKGISFDVEEGAIITLIGANGAGKSTTLRAITRLVPVSAGKIEYLGEDITGMDTRLIVERGLSLVPEGRRVFPNLTALENLKIGAYLRNSDKEIADDIDRVYALFPRLKERHWQLAGTLSGGEQQMRAVGRAMMSSPKLLMMDEPSLGLAPLVVRDIFETILTLNAAGITILLVEQNANAALRIAHYGYVLETGLCTLQGTGTELLHNEGVREAYLGRTKAERAAERGKQ